MQFLKDFITTVTAVFFSSFLYSVEALSAEVINSATEPSSEAQLSQKEVSNCSQGNLKAWPLPMMTHFERESRLKWFSKYEELHVVSHSESIPADKCRQLLDRLASWKDIEVLRPTYKSSLPNNLSLKFSSLCPNLDIDRAYDQYKSPKSDSLRQISNKEDTVYGRIPRLFNSYIYEESFLKKSREDKEAETNSYVESVKNIEYYDLSMYAGTGVWGYFSEAAYLYKKNVATGEYYITADKQCFPVFKAIQKIFNAHTCNLAYDPYEAVMRLSNMTYSNDLSGMFANASVNGFVSISGELYRISIRWDSPVLNLASIISDSFRLPYDIYLDKIQESSMSQSLELREACSFSNY